MEEQELNRPRKGCHYSVAILGIFFFIFGKVDNICSGIVKLLHGNKASAQFTKLSVGVNTINLEVMMPADLELIVLHSKLLLFKRLNILKES